MTRLSDVKADLNQMVRVLGVIESMAFDLYPLGVSPAVAGQFENIKAVFALVMPFAKKLEDDLGKFPDTVEP